jgi:Signal transduction histidine kinase
MRTAKQSGDKEKLINAYIGLGDYYNYRNADSLRYFAQKGLELVDTSDSENYCTFISFLAESYFEEGNMEQAELYYKKCYDALKANGNNEDLIDICGALGVVNRRRGHTDKAIQYYTEGLDIALKIKNYDSQTNLYTNIAVLYAGLKRLDDALEYTKRATEAAELGATPEQYIYANSTRTTILTMVGKTEEASGPALNNYKLAQKLHSNPLLIKSIIPLLSIYDKIGKTDSVRYFMKIAEPIALQLPKNSNEYLGLRETQANIYSNLGEYKKSNEIFEEILNCKDNIQTPLHTLYLKMAQNDEDAKDYKGAMKYAYLAYKELNDLSQNQIQEQTTQMNVQFQTKEKELEILTLKEQRLKRTIGFIAVLLILSLIVITLLILNHLFRRRQQRLKNDIAEQKREYVSLQNQIGVRLAKEYINGLENERARLSKDLHDGICNNLLALEMEVQQSKMEATLQNDILSVLSKTRNEARDISHALMPPVFQYATIDQIIEDLAFRMNEKVKNIAIHYQCLGYCNWADISNNMAYELYRITQEVMNNIIKHSNASYCDIVLSAQNEYITLSISNNGFMNKPSDKYLGLEGKLYSTE